MKSKLTILSTLALLYAGSALAGGGPYPEPAIPTSDVAKSRAEVVAEMRVAQRLGLLTSGEEDVRTPTPAQARQIADAGRRAAEGERVSAESAHAD